MVLIKILQVCEYYYPLWESGGVARSVYQLSESLANKGHDVTVYTSNYFNIDRKLITNKPQNINGVKVYYFENCKKYFKFISNFIRPFPYYLPHILKTEIQKFDIIHIHEHRTVFAIMVYRYAKKYNIPIVLQPRGSLPRGDKPFIKELFDKIVGYEIINYSNIIIASSIIESQAFSSIIENLKHNKIIHIPNGFNSEDYDELPNFGIFRKKYSIPYNNRMILFMGRIHKRKGAEILIKAFIELINKFDNLTLVIAGPDEGYLKELKNLSNQYNLTNSIIFPGPLYGQDKLEAYVDADVFVLPSKDQYESFGNVAMEAALCGNLVVVTKYCGVSEWLPSVIISEPNYLSLFSSISSLLEMTVNEQNSLRMKLKEEAASLNQENITTMFENIYYEEIN